MSCIEPPMQYGWVCPRCGNVYSPAQFECWNCNSADRATIPDTYPDSGGTFVPETTTFTCISCGRLVIEYGMMDESGMCSVCLGKEMLP